MTDRTHEEGWSDVDTDENADHYTEYLENITDADAIQEYKKRSYHLLRPTDGDHILDVGCGTGEDVLALAEHVGPDGEVVGVDNSATMVETAREQGHDIPTVRFMVDDALDLSFATNSFDAARADRVLLHLETPAEALRELKRVTRPGGRISVSDPDFGTLIIDAPGGYTEQFLSVAHANNQNPTMGRQLYRLAREAGLDEIAVDTWTLTFTEFAFMKEVSELDRWTDAMQAAGEATESDVEEWIEGLQQADDQGLLFASGTGFTVAGTVPGRTE